MGSSHRDMDRDPLLRQASIKPDCPAALKRMIEDRDVFGIRNFVDSNNETYFKVAVVTLTIHNDPEILQKILQWGKSRGLTPNTNVGKEEMQDPKAIHVACQQNFKRCMNYLFEHGYRRKDDEQEVDEGIEEDQVKKFLAFKGKSNIHYLSLEFTEQEPSLEMHKQLAEVNKTNRQS